MALAKEIIVIFACYGLGCFATGYYLVRLRTGRDIRDLGSGSAGATNVGRALGTRGLVFTSLADFAKGLAAVGLAQYLALRPWALILAMQAVVIGHIWPLQLGFRGGKGIATGLGALLAFDSGLTLVLVLLFGLLVAVLRRFTLSGLAVVTVSPLVAAVMGHSAMVAGGLAALAGIILIAHRANIGRILREIRGTT